MLQPSALAFVLIACCCASGAATDSYPTQPPQPPTSTYPSPPTAPQFKDAYYHLTWTWMGGGFAISSTGVAQAPSGSTTYTGSLTAIETWSLKPVDGVTKWVCNGIGGYAIKGTSENGKAGFARFSESRSTLYNLPGYVKARLSVDSSGVTLPVAGATTTASESTVTTYSPTGAVVQKTGSQSTTTATSDATSDRSTSTATTYNGAPGATLVVHQTSSTVYTDATRKHRLTAESSRTDTATSVFPSGLTASRSITTSSGKTTWFDIIVAGGTHEIQQQISTRGSDSVSFNADGTTKSSFKRTVTSQTDNFADPPGDGVSPWRVQLVRQRVSAATRSQQQGQPDHQVTLERTTSWYPETGGPSAWQGTLDEDGQTEDLYLSWDKELLIDDATVDFGNGEQNLDLPRATYLYRLFYQAESNATGAPAPTWAYPFYPNIQTPIITNG